MRNSLASIAKDLPEPEGEKEAELRPQLVAAVTQFANDKSELGKQRAAYRRIFKAERTWIRASDVICIALRCAGRTVRRIIEDYEAASVVSRLERTVAQKQKIRLEAKKNSPLVDE